MVDKPIFYDSDVLICFLAINQSDILKNLFSKVIVPEPVYIELINITVYQNIKQNLNFLMQENFVEIAEVDFASPEGNVYNMIRRGFWSGGNWIGRGESASMALAIENKGIVASNNLSDVQEICDDYEIPVITASIILAFCFELNLMDEEEVESIWQKILTKTKQIMPTETFGKYYDELFKNDCNVLLKGYDFKKHYLNSKKVKI